MHSQVPRFLVVTVLTILCNDWQNLKLPGSFNPLSGRFENNSDGNFSLLLLYYLGLQLWSLEERRNGRDLIEVFQNCKAMTYDQFKLR